MSRPHLAAVEGNDKEIERQLKKPFIQSLNDTQMLAEVICVFTKAEENTDVTSEQV